MTISRRGVLKSGLVGLGANLAPARLSAQAGGGAGITGLLTCGLDAPLALGGELPRFSWSLGGDLPQTHYRVAVARTVQDLTGNAGLVWDSGKVASPDSNGIDYGGPSLSSREGLWWQVEAWLADGTRTLSDPARFETGLAAEDDWSGDWIAVETEDAFLDRQAGLHWLGCDPAMEVGQTCAFRTVIDCATPESALFLASAVQLAGVWLNGVAIDPAQEEPVAWTSMTPYPLALRQGRNVIGVAVRRIREWGVPEPVFAGMVRRGDGTGRHSTQDGWRSMVAPPDGWQQAAFNDGDWPAARKAGRVPEGEPWLPGPAMHLRRQVDCTGPIRSARLYATALGTYEAWLNGSRVSDMRLAPGSTDPARRALYQAYDVTDLLRPGANMLGLWVGDGWYGSEFSVGSRFPFGPAPCRLRAQLEIEYGDGTREVIASDADWQTCASPVLSSEIYDGEVYDARLEVPGWASVGGASDGWRPARVVDRPAARVEPELCAPIRVTQAIRPVAVSQPRPGIHVFDFGQNFAGWVQLSVAAPAGTRVEMRFAEVLLPSGEVDQSNLRSAFARDVYVTRGGGSESWEPRFTYHGFRYVEVHGLPGDPADDTLVAQVAHTDLAMTGQFRVGDPVVQRFWRNSVWSQRSNFFGLPTDCPQRDERMGWMGDAQVFWPAAAYNMDLRAYTARVARDIRAGQTADGRFPDVIPPKLQRIRTASPGWADAGIILPHASWRQYGDTAIIRENWQAMDRYMAWIAGNNPDHIWANERGEDFGDWLAVDAKEPGDPTTPKDLIGTAFWASNADMMAQMAQAAGQDADARRYRTLFDTLRRAFVARFVAADGTVGNGSQTGNVLAIRFCLLDDAQRAIAGRNLAADIARRGDTLSTGFLGTPHILDALADAGRADVAVTLLMQRKWPSWGYMVEQGATTMWERWNSDRGDVAMNSFNHYAFGAIGSFLYRRIAGIAPLEPGFRRVRIAPILDARLGGAGADYRSVSGDISVHWTRTGSRVKLDVVLPAGVSGELAVPPGARIVTGQAGAATAGHRVLGGGTHTITLDLGS